MASIELTFADVTTARRRVRLQLQQFIVFDGSARVVIEARNAEDARCLCIEMDWEFICACED